MSLTRGDARPPPTEQAEAPPTDVEWVPMDSAQRGQGPFVWRFNLYHRLTHAAVIVSFYLLVLTGLPLRFTCAMWSEALIRLFGGVEMAGRLHRVGAIITFGYFGAHLLYAIRALLVASDRKRLLWGRESIVPQPQDVRDFFAQIRWYLGLGPRPQFGRYSYVEKFDYLAVFWGVAIIGGSGLLLWFPEFFARYLPGWTFNVATVVHGEEALLAAGFIFTIHFFNVHLRREKFPLDAVMFHGRATVDYMVEEHPAIADKIEGALGQPVSSAAIEDAPAPPPTPIQSYVSAILGLITLSLGIVCIGLIVWAVAFC